MKHKRQAEEILFSFLRLRRQYSNIAEHADTEEQKERTWLGKLKTN